MTLLTRQDGTVSRRRFLVQSSIAALSSVSASVLGGKENKPPSDRLHIAGVGIGARGVTDLERCQGEAVVALCDVDWKLAATGFRRFPKAAKYRDWRTMLDREKSIDAVVVATPDHTHAVITADAMKRGKHVYTEMPLAHSVWEVRTLVEIAKETGVTTQMGNDVHSGPGVRLSCEWIWSGELGDVTEVHCWTNRPVWPQGTVAVEKGAAKVPEGLAWDLWLGPAPEHAFSRSYHPYRWRGFRDFGTGALGAIGCHIMDAPFWALKLGEAKACSIEADATPLGSDTFPQASTIRYRFPARGDMPPVTLSWYDGGRRPPRPPELPKLRGMGSNGSLFIGTKRKMVFGAITAGTLPGQAGPRFLPEFSVRGKPPRKLSRVKDPTGWRLGGRHQQEWIAACKTGKKPCADFQYAGPLTELALLGNAALISGRGITWDRDLMTITNIPEAEKLLRRAYRRGWSL